MQLRDELENRLRKEFVTAKISVQVDGSSAMLRVVSDDFVGHSQVRRQQAIYALINDLIQSGELHAVTISAKTPAEIAISD